MGRNSKAKRDAKRKAERRPAGRPAATASAFASTQHAHVDEGSLNRMFRSTCSDCGSANLSWMTTGELRDQVPDEDKARWCRRVDLLGADGEAWHCLQCGNFGIMGPAQGGL